MAKAGDKFEEVGRTAFVGSDSDADKPSPMTLFGTNSIIPDDQYDDKNYGWNNTETRGETHDWVEDEFGNSFYTDDNGDYHFYDKFGDQWF